MSEVFTGQVVGLSKIATATPAAFCRAVTGGTFTFGFHNARQAGIGGQVVARKGTLEATLEATCIGVDKADLALWFPTTAGVQVAAFPDFLVEADDGTNGKEFVLTGGQPASIEVSDSGAEDAMIEYKLAMKFAVVTPQAPNTKAPVYNAYVGHTGNNVIVQLAAADKGVISWSLKNDLGTVMYNPRDTKVAGARSFPQGYIITKQGIVLSCVTGDPYIMEAAAAVADTWTPLAFTIAMTNGTAGQNITFTGSDFIPESVNLPLSGDGINGFGHEFAPGPGTVYNRVVIT